MYILYAYSYLIFPYILRSFGTENFTPIPNAVTLQLYKPIRKDQ